MKNTDRQKISSEEFVKIWRGEYRNDPTMAHFYNTREDTQVEAIIIKDIEIVGNIEIKNDGNKLKSIRFDNTKIESFSLENCKCDSIKFGNQSELKNFTLGIVSKVTDLIFEKSTVLREVGFFLGGTCVFLNISDSKIFTIRTEDKSSKIGQIELKDSTIVNLFIDSNTEAESITLTRTQLKYLKIYNNTNLDFLTVNNSTILDFELRNVIVSDNIFISDSVINEFYIKAKTLPEININDTFIESFNNRNSISSTFNLKKCKIIDFVMSEMKTGKDGLMQLIDCEINNLRFDTILNLGGFNISNLEPLKEGNRFNNTKKSRNLAARDPSQKGKDFFLLEPFSIPVATISILNSDMGKMMISSDLSKFTKFEFLNSKIIEVFIAGPKLPEITTINEKSDLDSQKRIAYNQIKKIYENRGDNVTALDYLAKEMNVYRTQVQNKKDGKIPGELFQLNFNKFTNQHGTEWRFAFILTLGISLGLFLVYYWLLFGFNIGGQFNFNAIPYYFEFLNPTHKSNFIKEFDINKNSLNDTFALLIDYSSRLIVPLFLYQMIQAFRKYGKK